MVITAVLWLERPVDDLLSLLRERLVERFPRFRQRIVAPVGQGPCWQIDPAFRLEAHVRHSVLGSGRRALQELVSERMSQPLDMERPPWVFEQVDGALGGAALVCRIHHSIADGVSLARVLLQLTDEAPTPPPSRSRPPWHASWLQRLEEVDLLEAVGAGAEAALEAERLLVMPLDPPSALRGPLGRRKVAAWSPPLSLAAVKEVGKRTRSTVNDVLVTAVATALHRHLEAAGTPREQLRAFVPINLRPLDEPLPRELGNRFSILVLPLPLGPMSSTERLAEVRRATRELKHSPQAEVVWAVLTAMGSSPKPVEDLVVELMGKKASLILTNVPGPQERLHLGGAGIDGVMVWVPQSGDVGLGVSIFSYDGEVTIGVCGDAGVLPDPDGLVARIVEGWEELRTEGSERKG